MGVFWTGVLIFGIYWHMIPFRYSFRYLFFIQIGIMHASIMSESASIQPPSSLHLPSSTTTTATMTQPPPLTIPPRLQHKQSIILLHGRGGTGPEFGPSLIFVPIRQRAGTGLLSLSSTGETETSNLAQSFPNAKWIFPTATRGIAR